MKLYNKTYNKENASKLDFDTFLRCGRVVFGVILISLASYLPFLFGFCFDYSVGIFEFVLFSFILLLGWYNMIRFFRITLSTKYSINP